MLYVHTLYTRHNIDINTCTQTYTCGSKMMSMSHTIITLIFIFQLDCFMINLVDDYHNILSKHVPTDLQKTKIAHMASSMLDIHPHIPAIKRTTVMPHRQVKINIRGENKTCLGGSNSCTVLLHINRGLKDMRNHFIDQLPAQMKKSKSMEFP